MRFEWVPEEDEAVDITLNYPRSDLLIAAQRTALELADFEVQLIFEQLTGRARRAQFVASQEIAIKAGQLQKLMLLIVVSHHGYGSGLTDGGGEGVDQSVSCSGKHRVLL